MIASGFIPLAPVGGGLVFSLEEGAGSSILRLLLFAAIFIGPAIFKSIKEAKRKREEAAQRSLGGGEPSGEALEVDSSENETDEAQAAGDSAREQWESLMRGEVPAQEPVVASAPPPIPVEAKRRVLTESRPLTDEPAMTDLRTPEVATAGQSYEGDAYDGVSLEKPGPHRRGLGADFAEFKSFGDMSTDRAGSSADRVGAAPGFTGSALSQGLGARAEIRGDVLAAGEIGAAKKARAARQLALPQRLELRRMIIGAEILGPPLALRDRESGPSRPLGWL